MNRKVMYSLQTLAAVTAVSLANPALAQAGADTPEEAIADDGYEITVTARKRDERLQEVPESVTVFSADNIEKANIQGIRDFVDLTPNVLIRETFRTNETFLTMRGIASAQGTLPPASIVVDGVQIGANDFLNQDLLDVERIEVLKGPQGALFGQGAIAGAINIVTKKPTNDFEGMAYASYGNADSWRLAGAVGGAVVEDRLFFRVSGQYRNTDGLIKNAAGKRISFSDQGLVRGLLRYEDGPLTISLRGSWAEGDGSCCIQDRAIRDPANPDPTRLIFLDLDDVTNPGATSNLIGRDRTRFRDASAKIDYDFGAFTFTSVTGWADVRQALLGDADFTSAPVTIAGVSYPLGLGQDIVYATNFWNQEVRLTSPGSGPFRWIVGGYYAERRGLQKVKVGPLGQDNSVTPVNANLDVVTNSEAWAVFGQADVDLSDKFTISGSLRYDHDRQDSENRIAVNSLARATFKRLQPKFQLSYDWSDDLMLYATYSTGFRTGGFNQNFKFANETTSNYEIGFKSTLANGAVTLNGSFFHTDYRNQLFSFVVFNPSGPSLSRTINIPLASIDGLEVELNARLSDQLTLSLGAGVTDSVIKEVVDDPILVGETLAVGNKSPLVSPFTFNASVNYEAPLSDDVNLVFNASYQRLGGFFFDLGNDVKTGTHDFVDGKIGLEFGNISVGLWAKNLTNSRQATNVSITGSNLRVPNQPRSYGLEARVKF